MPANTIKDYNNSTPYDKGDIVLYKDAFYQAQEDSWGVAPSNKKTWKLHNLQVANKEEIEHSQEYESYDHKQLYKKGDVVDYGTKHYIALSDTMGNAPSSKTHWKILKGYKDKTEEIQEPEEEAQEVHSMLILHKKGDRGEDGRNGYDGLNGRDGKDGRDGADGRDGRDGRDGVDGKSYDPKELDELRQLIVTGNGSMNRYRLKSVGSGTSLIAHAKPRAGELKTLVAGTGITLTPTANSITITSTAAGYTPMPTVVVNSASQAAATNTCYVTNNGTLCTVTLPATPALGDELIIIGLGAGGWSIAQNAGQKIQFGNSATTVGVGGSLASQNQFDVVHLKCITANTTYAVISAQGNMTVT